MRNSIATYKESLSRIANEVLDAAEEIDVPLSNGAAAAEDAPTPGRRSSRRSPRLTPPVGSPAANGAGSGSTDEIAKYKADIRKLQTSEAEIKALSFNYASILKEKEEQLSKLREENSSLRKSLEAKSAVEHESRDDSQKTLSNNSNARKPVPVTPVPVAVSAAVPARVASTTVSAAPVRAVVTAAVPARVASTGIADQSPIRSPRHISQINSRSAGSHALKDNVTRSDGFSNGTVRIIEFDAMQRKTESISTNSQGNGEEHANLLEENHRSMAAVQASHESEIEQLKVLLDSEHENSTIIKLKLQEEQRLNESSQKELHDLKMDKERISSEMIELHKELNKKISELRRLQVELNRRDMEEKNESLESMKDTIRALEKENAKLKIEKDELEASLKLCMKCAPENLDADDLDNQNRKSVKSNEVIEEMTLSIRQLEDTLKDTCTERDKAIQEVARLKQHLLDKELEDTDKMDEDSKIIEELTATSEYQRAQILQLEKALRQERTKKEEIDKHKNDEIQRSNELIDRLKQKLADCMRTVDSKNVELLNLQTALGQYYAEIEAKERLGRDLAMTREESATLSESLKVANQGLETVEREKEDIAAKLLQAERMLLEGKLSIQKLGEDNSKLRRALEQSMMRLNRMSLDSDNYVDRRIVIKLLVTYFQRNHSKEVLDLMVRMLGFSEEDKQRIGFAQHAAGKGVVRGVLGLPGRLVGGILGGSSPEASSPLLSENQSFADLWVDFLLKATEERERRESSEAAGVSSSAQDKGTNTRMPPVLDHGTNLPNTVPRFPTVNLSANQIPSLRAKQNPFIEHSDSEFATVPLTSSVSPSERSSSSSLQPRY